MYREAIGFLAALLTMFAFVPQVFKALKTRSVNDISMVTLLQLGLGVSLWVIYGIFLKNAIIIMANAVTLTTVVVLIFLYHFYERAKR